MLEIIQKRTNTDFVNNYNKISLIKVSKTNNE